MNQIKFERKPRRGIEAPASRYMLDCPHGTTYVTTVDGAGWGEEKTERIAIQALVAKHEDEEGCGCALRWLKSRQAGHPAKGAS